MCSYADVQMCGFLLELRNTPLFTCVDVLTGNAVIKNAVAYLLSSLFLSYLPGSLYAVIHPHRINSSLPAGPQLAYQTLQ
jgi:hypothetical protein